MTVYGKTDPACFIPPGAEDKDHNEVFDISTEVLSTLDTLVNLCTCTGIDGGVYDYVEALGDVFTPGSKKQSTPRDTKFNHASCYPMAKSGTGKETFLTYLEEVTECFEHTAHEFSENITNFSQNKKDQRVCK